MANRKISDLTALTAPASGDLLPIVDISEAAAADKNKKITIQSLFQGIPVNLGIGTASPAQAVDVRTATGNAYINIGRNSQSTGQVGYYLTGGTSGTDWILYQPISSNDFRIFGNSGDRVTVTSTGSVGIANTSPGGTVDIKAAASTAPLIVQGPSSEFARIDSSARLLVGTSSDSGGALLQVNGDRIRIGTAKTPASATATGTTGEIAWDANYIYVCTATNTWKRTAIATW